MSKEVGPAALDRFGYLDGASSRRVRSDTGSMTRVGVGANHAG
jgi:hypothetical protein